MVSIRRLIGHLASPSTLSSISPLLFIPSRCIAASKLFIGGRSFLTTRKGVFEHGLSVFHLRMLLSQKSYSVSSCLTSKEEESQSNNEEKNNEKKALALSLACLIDETSTAQEKKPKSRVKLKRFLEQRIKKRVKEQFVDGKFKGLLPKVIANVETLRDAYDCIRVQSNVDLSSDMENLPFDSIAKELLCGTFDVSANTYSITTKGPTKELLVIPNLKLTVVQYAMRIVLEVVYKPHFLKISHGGRNGRDHLSALRYIKKEVPNPNWWFSVILEQKTDDCILNKILSVMSNMIEDPELNAMLTCMHRANVLNLEFGGFSKGLGLPQEGVLSPILMNIYLDIFDREIYRITMKYEALEKVGLPTENIRRHSKLRSWFKRQIKSTDIQEYSAEESSSPRVHCCRFMDEIFIAVSGSEEIALACKSDIEDFLKNSLLIEVIYQTGVEQCDGAHGIRFLGTSIQRGLKDSPAVRVVHKLKDKIKLLAMQKREAWESGTFRIGKKWLAHGLKKVKESEIKHLSGNDPLLNRISDFRKPGMKTDHWYKILLKVWMQGINAVSADTEESVLSKHIIEPSLPQELVDSYQEFQNRAQNYVSSETASTIALLPGNTSSLWHTQVLAPIHAIKKRLHRYGLTNTEAFPRTCHMLVLLDDDCIIDWFRGIVHRWITWYKECDNFNDVKLIIFNEVRLSCIRTLAAKYRTHESKIEKKFDMELSKIPFVNEEIDNNISYEAYNMDDSVLYGIRNSGLCLLSLARIVSKSRPCSCFVMGCVASAPCVYTIHVMERQKFPGWKTGFSSCIHPSLNGRKIGLCKHHLKDLFLGYISLQSIDFGAWR